MRYLVEVRNTKTGEVIVPISEFDFDVGTCVSPPIRASMASNAYENQLLQKAKYQPRLRHAIDCEIIIDCVEL